MNRGSFLLGAASGLVAATTLPATASEPTSIPLVLERNGSVLSCTIARHSSNGWYIDPDGYAQCNALLQDEVAHVVEPMVPSLLILLADVQHRLQGATIAITDGLRTPRTNASTEGAARNSRHMHRDAVDCYVNGLSMERLFAVAATSPYCGGLGLYDNHVHMDTWHVRTWAG